MFVRESANGQLLVTSASDLTAASNCEFAFLRRVDVKLGRDVTVPPDDDPMLQRAGRLGDVHEATELARLRQQWGDGEAGLAGGVVMIPKPASMDLASLSHVASLTLEALEGRADVVFQATFYDAAQRLPKPGTEEPTIAFLGLADFLELLPDGTYEVQDTKLARRAKVTALMQLAAYAEQLERIGIPVAPRATLILGDGARSMHKLADIAPVFRSRRARLHRILLERYAATGADGHRESAAAIAWGAAGIVACGRCEVCEPEVQRTRDPLLIAGIRGVQRNALINGGYPTLDAVASALPEFAAGEAVDGIAQPVLERLGWQALLQTQASLSEVPPVQLIDVAALAGIPEANPGDLFFDFEGDPLYLAPGAAKQWGIDYLFGMVDNSEQFTAFWAHDPDAEREALIDFLKLVEARRREFPGMHIYHYASYERTHLLSIAARHGVGETAVDELLREHVLVDLYPIVRSALRIGSRSYSIKKLEPLYMGAELRNEDGVTNAAQSVTEYAEATEQLRADDPDVRSEGQRRLDEIADYNRYDCVSTLRLRDWLLGIASANGVLPYPYEAALDADEHESFEPSTTAAALTMHAALTVESEQRDAIALAASAIDYYARESKSFWWAHFARLVDPIEDWADARDVMVVEPNMSRVDESWIIPDKGRVERRLVRLRGEIAPGSKFRAGGEVFAIYAHPAPFGTRGTAPGSRGAKLTSVYEVDDDAVTLAERLSRDDEPYQVLPIAITPGPPPRVAAQERAIEEWGSQLARALDRGNLLSNPATDLLRRVPPRARDGKSITRIESAEALAAVHGDEEQRQIGAVVDTLVRLDRSALAVQGPPGTGKTYLAARVIRRLVEDHGWVIGVTAQSHAVVENVLAGVVHAGLDPEQVGKAPQRGSEGTLPYTSLRSGQQSRFIAQHRERGRGCVIGGTAWDFSNETRVARGELDLLVIDEAGQFSLAPTIAVAVSTQRLLLLGDPQQLPQVSQGTHPAPVDTSALGWLLGAHDTMPDSQGVFLAETRRMHPELAVVVSELSYENRLRSHPSTAERRVVGGGPAGLVWHGVTHSGNSTHSLEEAAEVVRIVRTSLDGMFEEPGETARALTTTDIIVVAAYNAQVECVSEALEAAGLSEIRVGTVDKFQGQEAVIAIVTLAASRAEDIPRGLEFLLLRNRLNVAISRAQWAAHLVSSTSLGDGLPASADGVAALSGYLRLLERATLATESNACATHPAPTERG